MAKHTYLGKGAAGTQEVETGSRVAHKVGGGGFLHLTSHRGLRGTVVVAQRGNALTGQIVGNDEKRLVVEHFFITILLAAARHEQHDCWFLTAVITHGPDQRSSQGGAVGLVAEGHLLCSVGIGRLRCLRALHLGYALCQHKRRSKTILFERAVELAVVQPCAIGHADGLHLHGQRVVAQEV